MRRIYSRDSERTHRWIELQNGYKYALGSLGSYALDCFGTETNVSARFKSICFFRNVGNRLHAFMRRANQSTWSERDRVQRSSQICLFFFSNQSGACVAIRDRRCANAVTRQNLVRVPCKRTKNRSLCEENAEKVILFPFLFLSLFFTWLVTDNENRTSCV